MSTATDPEFGRDVMFFVIFLAVALVDSLVWQGFTRRHPPEAQRPGDVGQFVGTCAGSCLLLALGLGAMAGVVLIWVAGWQ